MTEEHGMAIREMFRGDRDENRGRDRDRWRDEWRDENRGRQYGGGERDWERESGQRGYGDYGSSGRYGGRESPQYYGQSGRSDWGGQEYGRQQEYGGGPRGQSQDEYGQMERWSSGLDAERYGGGRRYSGGFYTGEGQEREAFRREQYPGSQYGGSGYGRSEYGGSQYGRGQYESGRQFGQPGGSMYGGDPQARGEGEYRGRGPRGYQRSDERIREDVCERLSDDPFIDASDVDITVSSCEVTLSGTVSSREQKRRAEDLIENVSGVKDVKNNLRVSSGQQTGTSGAQSMQGMQSQQGGQAPQGAQSAQGTQQTQGRTTKR
jgi:osmotically-inducible protein OsmY